MLNWKCILFILHLLNIIITIHLHFVHFFFLLLIIISLLLPFMVDVSEDLWMHLSMQLFIWFFLIYWVLAIHPPVIWVIIWVKLQIFFEAFIRPFFQAVFVHQFCEIFTKNWGFGFIFHIFGIILVVFKLGLVCHFLWVFNSTSRLTILFLRPVHCLHKNCPRSPTITAHSISFSYWISRFTDRSISMIWWWKQYFILKICEYFVTCRCFHLHPWMS